MYRLPFPYYSIAYRKKAFLCLFASGHDIVQELELSSILLQIFQSYFVPVTIPLCAYELVISEILVFLREQTDINAAIKWSIHKIIKMSIQDPAI